MVAKDIHPKSFKKAFSQSIYPVLNQLDTYHIYQSLNRALGARKSEYKDGIRKALKTRNKSAFKRWLDTYESTLDDQEDIKKVNKFRSYILENWERIFDWREFVEQPPKDARSLGAMESTSCYLPNEKERDALECRRQRSNGEN